MLEENKEILWWIEFNSGFKQASRNFTITEAHEYKTGAITFKVIDTLKETGYVHFADRNRVKGANK